MSRGFISTVRKYRRSARIILPLFTFFILSSSVDSGSNCKLYQQVALETAYSASKATSQGVRNAKLLLILLIVQRKKVDSDKLLYRKGMYCCYSIASDIQQQKSIIV